MKNLLSSVFLVFMASLPIIAPAKTLQLHGKPEASSPSVATVESGDKLIPIYAPEKSEWIKVADPKNGNVGWLRRQDIGLNDHDVQLYQKRFEHESGDKKNGPYHHEIYEYKGTEKLSNDQIKKMFNDIEQQQAKMHATVQSMFNEMMNHFSEINKLGPVFRSEFERPPFIIVPDDVKVSSEKNSTNTKK